MKYSRLAQITFSGLCFVWGGKDSDSPLFDVIIPCKSLPLTEFQEAESQNRKMMYTQLEQEHTEWCCGSETSAILFLVFYKITAVKG